MADAATADAAGSPDKQLDSTTPPLASDETSEANDSGAGVGVELTVLRPQYSVLSVAPDDEPGEDVSLVMRDGAREDSERPQLLNWRFYWAWLRANKWLLLVSAVLVVLLVVASQFLWTTLSWKAWFSITITILVLLLLLKDTLPAYFVLVLALALVLLADILPVKDALAGFANEGVITIGVLFVVAKAIELSNALDPLIVYVLAKPKSIHEAIVRLMVPVSIASAFLNNTPLVAMMIPVVSAWARSSKLAVSHLMIPLSFAAVLGGTCTIIGSAPNLVVVGLLYDRDPTLSLGFFEIGIVGVPLAIVATIYIVIAAPYLLPNRQQGMDQFLNNPREYTAAVRVEEKSKLVGQAIEKAGLRNLESVFLFQVVRNNEVIVAPDAQFVLEGNDVLYFSGVITHMQRVYAIAGLVPETNQVNKVAGMMKNRCLLEVVVNKYSPLVGKTVKEARFRSKYNAAIIAIHRRGERIETPIGEIVLQPGDTLLCEAHKSFLRYHNTDQDFALMSMVGEGSVMAKPNHWRTAFVLLLSIAMITVSTANLTTLLTAGLGVSCIFLLTGILTFDEARESIQGDVLLLIAAAFALGTALDKTGAAAQIAGTITLLLTPLGSAGILAGLYFMTTVLTEVISNAATVSLMFPIAWQFVLSGVLNYKAMCFTLMLAGSSSFCTPIGYQTNLMVQTPGGYKFIDYVKFGLPLNFLAWIVTVTIAYLVWNR